MNQPLPKGPWTQEPNRLEFKHAGFHCLLVRGPVGAWCGYVALPPGHKWRDAESYNDIDCDVHGGLTYMNKCQGEICHTPDPGETDDLVWIGFDCAHAGDLIPQVAEIMAKAPKYEPPFSIEGYLPPWERDTYRTIDYAKKETERLAEQAAAAQ